MAQRQRLNKEIQQIDDKTENVYAQEAQLNAKGSLKLTTQVGPNGKAAVSDADITTYGQVLQLIECLLSVRANGFLTTPLLDGHWLVIEASPKTNGCSKKSIHLQVAFLERTNVTNVCV